MIPRVEPDILELLKLIDLDKYIAADKVHCHHRTAQRILRAAHQLKLCHIVGWETIYNAHTAVYRFGKGKDKVKPAPITTASSQKKRRKNPEVRAKEAKIKRVNRLKTKAVPLLPDMAEQIRNFNLLTKGEKCKTSAK